MAEYRETLRAVLLPLCLVAAAASLHAEAPNVEPCTDDAAESRWVEQLNRMRAQGSVCGAALESGRLVWEPRLADSARSQAADLALRDTISHVDAQQRSFAVRLRATGYPTAAAGETLAAGQQAFDGVLQAWQSSAAHCAILMQPRYTEVGLACVQRKGTRYERFWVAHLAAPARR